MSAVTITGRLLRSKNACKTSFDVVRHLLPFGLSTAPEKNIGIAFSLVNAYEMRYWSEGTSRLCDDIFWMIDGISWEMAMEMCNFENHIAQNGGASEDVLCIVQYLSMLAEVL